MTRSPNFIWLYIDFVIFLWPLQNTYINFTFLCRKSHRFTTNLESRYYLMTLTLNNLVLGRHFFHFTVPNDNISNLPICQNNAWCIKFRSKHSTVLLLCLLWNLMHQTLLPISFIRFWLVGIYHLCLRAKKTNLKRPNMDEPYCYVN